ncbi:thioesterase II family protein [Streptomyces sp. MMG1121]|uniref:thioesterase II family protein n=1 Tax=Streptomyces sp. MMG1121 TaxID=1415544 RepID=UPI0006AE70B8|nr:alpha/beta fold hydrolase [Streptomyces sp. MMG1121]KOV62335.1 oleoyl-ACP hydrolase [Streptomyces sp. MMG1121]
MTRPAVVADDWVRCFRPEPSAKVQLVCFPHAGGSASFFHPVARALPGTVETLALQYPGRQDRRAEPCVDDIAALADLVVEALAPRLDRPFAFFGHSMGATLAFEVTRRLEQRRLGGPLTLFASGRRAPSRKRPERVHLLDDDGLVGEIRRLSGTEAELLADEELLRMILPAVRSDYRAIETYTYRPGPPLNCPVLVLTGDDDPLTTIEEARAWSEHTAGEFDLKVFPGGHFYLAAQQAAVLRTITDRLGPHL